tara:strand:- start:443 stop:1021 length:579 start_codon:yes stop_codon:yes gene_type:complete
MGKELLKFEQPGYNPANHPFPTTMFKAFKREDGVVKCMDSAPSPYGWINDDQYNREMSRVDAFNRQCQRVVEDENASKAAMSEGWRNSPADALAAHEQLERWIGDEAAKRAHQDRLMSDAAKVEIAKAEETTPEHVAEVPVSRPGPKKKALKTFSAPEPSVEAAVEALVKATVEASKAPVMEKKKRGRPRKG